MVALDSHPDNNLSTLSGLSPLEAYGLPKPIAVPKVVKNMFKLKHHDKEPSAQVEMKSTQRKLEAVASYARQLDERITDESLTEEERIKARREKELWDNMSLEKETWAIVRTTKKDGWGAGVYGEGACPPGMVWR